jgi:hypothetical protein
MHSIINHLNSKILSDFLDGKITFKLASKESERFKGPFICSLIKIVKIKKKIGYLVELNQTFSGVDFGVKSVAINRFFLLPKHFGLFGKKVQNDVLIVLPININSETEWDENKILAWGFIYDINTS